MATKLPMEAIKDVLDAAGVSPVKLGFVRSEPHQVVFVNDSGGYAPIPEQGSDLHWRPGTVQVRIRSNPMTIEGAFEAGRRLAESVKDALLGELPAEYDKMDLETALPAYIGPDEEDRHEWTLNLTLDVLE